MSQEAGKGKAKGKTSRVAEVAGGSAAECAAVCCCCPFALLDLLLLATVRLPVGLCQRAMRNKKKKNKKKKKKSKSDVETADKATTDDDSELHRRSMVEARLASAEIEREMGDRFRSAGFWRSPSHSD